MGSPRKPSFTVTIDEDVLQAIISLTDALNANTQAHTGNTPVQTAEATPQPQEAPQEVIVQPTNYTVPNLQVPQQMIPTMQAPVAQEAPVTTPVGYQMPVQQPMQQLPVMQAPVQQMPVQQPLPTTVPTYTIEQIMQGFARAMDAGQPALALLQKYGANMVNEINPANYGLVATDLRAMGVQI